MKFIDLFAGLGGFHIALKRLGHECVFACEIDEELQELYARNFRVSAWGDIRELSPEGVPAHDILCAGFPCQPFSKAGAQGGLADELGQLIFDVERILDYHQPRYLILENVPHLARHQAGATWRRVEEMLRRQGYEVATRKLSPHEFGVPQIRERFYIVGARDGLGGFSWPEPKTTASECSITTCLEDSPPDARKLSAQMELCIDIWQEFLDRFPIDAKLPSFPIWAMEFGADYPYETMTPFALSATELESYRGSFGFPLSGGTREVLMAGLPRYAQEARKRFQPWKVTFIRQNRALYEANRNWIDQWKLRLLELPTSYQKFEWNCQGEARTVRDFILQFRASGLRVKRPTTSPSLVAMTETQVPIIGWEHRYMTPRECAKLQSMEELVFLPERPVRAYAALGNAVNTQVVEQIAARLLGDRAPLSVNEQYPLAVLARPVPAL